MRRQAGVMPPERRRALLEVAAKEFASAGYERASLNRVIATCGLSKSSFYYYFDSKEALFDAVVTEIGGALVEALALPDPAALRDDFWPTMSRLMRRVSELAERDPSSIALGRMFYLDDAPRGGALARAQAAIDAWLTAALAAGRRGGAVRDDLSPSLQARIAFAVLRAMDDWMVRNLAELTERRARDLAKKQLAALRRLLGRE